VSLLALGLAAANPSQSADLGKGAIELNPSLAYSHNSYSRVENGGGGQRVTVTTTMLDISGLIGYFVSDKVELSGGPLVTYESIDFEGLLGGRQSATAAGLIGGVALNFPSSGNVVPFLRGSVGFLAHSGDLYVDNATTVIAPLLEGGLRVMVGKSAAVNFVLGYQHRTNAFGVQDQSENSVTLGVGLSVFPVLRK